MHLGSEAERADLYNMAAGVQALDDTYGPELLLRSAAWLTVKESRASFAIEHEADQGDKVRRFAAAIGEFSGRRTTPCRLTTCWACRRLCWGTTRCGWVFAGRPCLWGKALFARRSCTTSRPAKTWCLPCMDAMRQCERRTRGAHSVARAAALSFAFVYLHPLADRNGRVHRFLVNHLMAADKGVPRNIVVPVSATIASPARGRALYDQVLEGVSRPFMQADADGYRFGQHRVCADGGETHVEFQQADDAQHVWRYLNLTQRVRYLSALLRQTVEHAMAEGALMLRRYDDARAAIKRWVEMPDRDADRIIRSLHQGTWVVNGKLRQELPTLFEEGGALHALHDKLVYAVRMAFEEKLS